MRMALDAFRSASDDHFVRGRQSSCAMPRPWLQAARQNPLDISALSAPQKQDHSFATHTIQRTLVKLFGLHASCILVSESDRRCITSFTGFASVAPVRLEISTRKLFTSEISQRIVEQSPASNAVLALRCSSSTRLSDNSNSLLRSVDSCIAEVVLVQLGHQTQRHEDRHFPDRSFTLQRPCCCSLPSTHSCWFHSCILSATFLTASSFAFLASLSGLVLGVQILGALRALSSISLFLCASLGPRCSLLRPATSHPSQSRVWGSSFGV